MSQLQAVVYTESTYAAPLLGVYPLICLQSRRCSRQFDDCVTVRRSRSVTVRCSQSKAEYTVEFISLMARFQAARRPDLEELIRTPTIKKVIGKYRRRIHEQLDLLEQTAQ